MVLQILMTFVIFGNGILGFKTCKSTQPIGTRVGTIDVLRHLSTYDKLSTYLVISSPTQFQKIK